MLIEKEVAKHKHLGDLINDYVEKQTNKMVW